MLVNETLSNSLELSKSSQKFIESVINSIKNLELEKWEHFLDQDNFLQMLPCNPVTKTTYKGNNSLLLLLLQVQNDWESNKYLTYNQIKKLGGSNKGCKGIPITHFFILAIALPNFKDIKKTLSYKEYEELSPEEQEKYRLQFSERISYVFNLSDVTGLPKEITEFELEYDSFDSEFDAAQQHLDLIIESNEVNFKHLPSERAFYNPSKDCVRIPHKHLFLTQQQYFSTAFHEIIHWTGHKDRLDRFEEDSYFGNEKYAFEELIAEIGAMLLLRDLDMISSLTNSLSYLKAWISHCDKNQDVDSLIYNAFYQAKRAINYINH